MPSKSTSRVLTRRPFTNREANERQRVSHARRREPAKRRASERVGESEGQSPSDKTRDEAWLGPAIHPGEILREEFLVPLGIGQADAARRLGVSLNRLNEIVLGKRGITADTALRLARLLKTSPQLWMRLQADWDLHQAMHKARRAS